MIEKVFGKLTRQETDSYVNFNYKKQDLDEEEHRVLREFLKENEIKIHRLEEGEFDYQIKLRHT